VEGQQTRTGALSRRLTISIHWKKISSLLPFSFFLFLGGAKV
jgi:hypothetical protein